MDFKGKNVFITGGRKGIGRQVVERFAEQGANLWVCSHSKSDAFENDMKELADRYAISIDVIYFDLMNSTEVEKALKEFLSRKIKIDILINNAGIAQGGMLTMQSMKMFRDTFEINFFGPILIMQMISKVMIRQRSGNIINIASVSGCENYGGNMSYGSSKAALIWATKELSKELAPFGIRVNVVSPGTTKTDMEVTRTEKQKEMVIERTAMKRMAEPSEIADAVMFLAGSNSSYITGHNLVVDGGRLNY